MYSKGICEKKSKIHRSIFAVLLIVYLLLGDISLICLTKLARLPLNSVTVCAFLHEIIALETTTFSIRLTHVFWINTRKNIENSPKRFCVHVIFLTSPRLLFYLLLLTASFWTEFSEHVFTLNLASIALNMHMVFFSLERSMQQRF